MHSTILDRHPAFPFGRIDHSSFARVGCLDHSPIESSWSRTQATSINDLPIPDQSPTSIDAILDAHMEGCSSIVVIICPAPPSSASIWSITRFGVQCGSAPTVTIGLDPIYFQTPWLIIDSAIAIVVSMVASIVDTWRDCVDIRIHSRSHS